jgi:hypothetical protein
MRDGPKGCESGAPIGEYVQAYVHWTIMRSLHRKVACANGGLL